jgi:voltage-gated potassium channel
MDKLREIILRSDTRIGRIFDIAIQVLIAISLLSISLETLPDLDEKTYLFLAKIEIIIVIIFTLEYLFRIILTEKKTSYLFSFYGIIDFLAILPFYLLGSVSFQILRILRFVRLFRILKLTRYTDAIARIGKAILIAKEELILFGVVTLMLLYLSAVGIYHFEHAAQPENYKSLFDCLWWAVATLTTVGYGDIYPITIGGRLFTFVILMLGLGVVAVPTGVIASALSSVRKDEK